LKLPESNSLGAYERTERAWKNVFQLWNENGRSVPLIVQRIGWNKNSWFVVTRIEVSGRQWEYFDQTGNLYGKAFGFFSTKRREAIENKVAELRNSGVYKWRRQSSEG
jgi:hypothetical protein